MYDIVIISRIIFTLSKIKIIISSQIQWEKLYCDSVFEFYPNHLVKAAVYINRNAVLIIDRLMANILQT